MVTNPTWTELNAVNSMLLCIKESPVASIDEADADFTNYMEALVAKDILHQTNVQMQTSGYIFNTTDNVTLSPDTSGHIYLPVNTLVVRSHYAAYTYFGLDGKLWDKEANTDIFTSSAVVDLILFLDWDSLPPVFAQYITKVASKVFVDRMRGMGQSQFLDREIISLKSVIEEMVTHQESPTVFDNYRIGGMLDKFNNPIGGNVRR